MSDTNTERAMASRAARKAAREAAEAKAVKAVGKSAPKKGGNG